MKVIFVAFFVSGNVAAIIGRQLGLISDFVSDVLFVAMMVDFAILGAAGLMKNRASDVLRGPVDKRAIGLVLDVVSNKEPKLGYDEQTRRLAMDTLVHLLQRFGPEDSGLLSPEHRAILAGLVRTEERPHVVNVLIAGIVKTGIIEAIRSLESVAAGKCRCKEQSVWHSAEAALPELRLWVEKARAGAVLLRAIAPPEGLSTVLLRPANSAAEGEQELLLRPTGD